MNLNTSSTSTLLDTFITNIDAQDLHSGVISCAISDHMPIFLRAKKCAATASTKSIGPITLQDINPYSLEEFRKYVANVNLESVLLLSDPNDAYNELLSIFKSAYLKYFPSKVLRPKKARKPWLTNTALGLTKQKDALYKRFVQTRDLIDLSDFKKFRNKVTSFLRQSKRNYLHNLFNNETLKRSDAVWQKLNVILDREPVSSHGTH